MGAVKSRLAWDGIERAKAAEEFGDLPDRVCTLITSHLDCADRFSWEATLEHLGADSLDIVELAMALEEEFDTEVTDSQADAWRTAGDLLRTVEAVVVDEVGAAIDG